MIVNTKTLWHGLVGINERDLKSHALDGEDLIIQHEGKTMKIKNDEIQARIHSESKHEFKDKYGKEPYKLVYFHFIETPQEVPVPKSMFN